MARKGYPGMGGGMGGGMNMQNMMAQAQKMQQNIENLREELNTREFTATAGGGVVKAVVNGAKQLVSLDIAPEAVDPDDIEMLQDLVIAAVNEALTTADQTIQSEMGKLTGGLGLGGMI